MAIGNDTMERNRETSFERDETRNLIASDKVEGTTVYNREGEKLGTIKNFMVGKRNGRVEYAVLSFGGLFGMGEKLHPLPWDTLDYDTEKNGYIVDIDKETLKSGPSFERGQEPEFNREYGEKVHSHYGRTY
jgi:sporulation protein YlmC with PRC-barrel domain